jgi:hypothetical protein
MAEKVLDLLARDFVLEQVGGGGRPGSPGTSYLMDSVNLSLIRVPSSASIELVVPD